MSDDLLNRILRDEPPLPPKDEQRYRALVRHYDAVRNKSMIGSTLVSILAGAILIVGLLILATASDTRSTMLGMLAIIFSIEVSIVNLWYGMREHNTRVIKELKIMQLMLLQRPAEAAAAPIPAQIEETPASLWERINPNRLSRWIVVGFIALIALCAIAGGVAIRDGYVYVLGLETSETDTVCLSDTKTVTMESAITSGFYAPRTLFFHNLDAKVESITSSDGKPLTYEQPMPAMCTIRDMPRDLKEFTVIWKLPLDALKISKGCVEVNLKPLAPVMTYTSKVRLDPNGVFEKTDEPGLLEWRSFFGGATWPRVDFGTCGIPVRNKAEGK